MPTAAKFWLVKTEPESFSIDNLAGSPGKTTCWDGVRNYQARNYMREMKLGERVLVYHSSTDPTAVVGLADRGPRVVSRPHRLGQEGPALRPAIAARTIPAGSWSI